MASTKVNFIRLENSNSISNSHNKANTGKMRANSTLFDFSFVPLCACVRERERWRKTRFEWYLNKKRHSVDSFALRFDLRACLFFARSSSYTGHRINMCRYNDFLRSLPSTYVHNSFVAAAAASTVAVDVVVIVVAVAAYFILSFIFRYRLSSPKRFIAICLNKYFNEKKCI